MMWWTNWVLTQEYTPEEIRDTSDVQDHAMNLFKDRGMMYPCLELVNAASIYVKQNIYDILSLPSWHKSRICLIGDAAHAVTHININPANLRSLLIPAWEHQWHWKTHLSLPYFSVAVTPNPKMYSLNSKSHDVNVLKQLLKLDGDKSVIKHRFRRWECIFEMLLYLFCFDLLVLIELLGRGGVIGLIGKKLILIKLSNGGEGGN